MDKPARLIWLCPEFTPYNEVLFKALAADPHISLRVEVMTGSTTTHPFEPPSNCCFEWGIANTQTGVDHQLISRLLREKYAWVVVSSYGKPTLVAAMKALIKDNRKFLYYTDTPLSQKVEWNRDRPRRRSWMRRTARYLRLQWIFHHAHRVLSTGRPGREAVIKLGCSEKKVTVFPYWVDLPQLLKTAPKEGKSFVFLSVGQLIYRKGFDVIIDALSGLSKDIIRDKVRLEIIGDGPLHNDLESLAVKRGLTRQIVFHGWLSSDQVKDKMKSVDVFIHASRWDPFGVVVLEAMAEGLPILGSDSTCAVLDRVEDGISGFVHRTCDAKQLAKHIMKTISNKEILINMGKAARSKAEEWPPERGVQIIKEIIFNNEG